MTCVFRLLTCIATRGNPLDDIEELTRVDFVMQGGQVYKSADRANRRPTNRYYRLQDRLLPQPFRRSCEFVKLRSIGRYPVEFQG